MRALCSGPNWQASSHLHNRNVTRQVTNVSSSLSNWKEDGSFCTPKVRDFLDGPNTQSSRRIEAARWLSGTSLDRKMISTGVYQMRIAKEYVGLEREPIERKLRVDIVIGKIFVACTSEVGYRAARGFSLR